jgi:hypothetical protein
LGPDGAPKYNIVLIQSSGGMDGFGTPLALGKGPDHPVSGVLTHGHAGLYHHQ